ncbi:MAG TPA: photosynthetic reaction center cytochrome c subunit family protein [Bryobacteraceae bacterium]|nr:photosynthetic reaction center cytochrome c subunit family protein [Bryobacteraceae bacterium]
MRVCAHHSAFATRDALLLLLVAAVTGFSQTQNPPNQRMETISRALGVECLYCHVADGWARDDKPQFAFASRMIKMQDGLNSGTLKDLGGVTCWSCHRGMAKPARMPRAGWEDRLAKWPENLKLAGGDAQKPAEQVYRNIQSLKGSPAGGLAMTMSVFAAALDVSCDHCHTVGDWGWDAKPAKQIARRMLGLFSEIPHYFEGGRQPSMQCFTCHQGSPKPQRRPPA